jgi:hypothetical protein
MLFPFEMIWNLLNMMMHTIVSTEFCELSSYLFKSVFICIWLLRERVHITGCQPSYDADLDEKKKTKTK